MPLRAFVARLALMLLPLAAVAPGCQRLIPGAAPGSASLFAPPPSVGSGQVHDVAVAAGPDGYLPIAPAAASPPGSHPLHVNVQNREWAWEQIVDVVDDYFRIERERQVQLVGDVLAEGRIDTYPQLGGTIIEPHLMDSVGRYNRWESTFQTIRRRAVVRVIPVATGYLIDVEVYKELEDLPQPELATAGAAAFRNDSSLPSRLDREASRTALSDFWIPLGRDVALEEDMKARLKACMGGH